MEIQIIDIFKLVLYLLTVCSSIIAGLWFFTTKLVNNILKRHDKREDRFFELMNQYTKTFDKFYELFREHRSDSKIFRSAVRNEHELLIDSINKIKINNNNIK